MEAEFSFDNVKRFFEEIASKIKKQNIKIIMVSHILPDKPDFINAIELIADVALIIPKPKSIDSTILESLKKKYTIVSLTRTDIVKFSKVVDVIQESVKDHSFIILDVGGYFANENLEELKGHFNEKFIGIIEDTENGHQKYDKILGLKVPVVSVARSALKDPEDFLVGQSIVFSAEFILREINELMIGKKALVIGYGKVGSSIAQTLVNRNISVSVYDLDPTKRIRAFSQGFPIPERKHALREADVIFSATGNISLTQYDLENLKRGCILFSATSSDDEFGINHNMHQYKKEKIAKNVDMYYRDDFYFYLANDGNAVNFIHGAKVGKFIHLVQAEMLFAIESLMDKKAKDILLDKKAPKNKIMGVSKENKNEIAITWIKHFNYSNLD